MSEIPKIAVEPLTSKSDYALWRLRIESLCAVKGCADVLDVRDEDDSDDVVKCRKIASGLIVAALSDSALRVVRSVVGKPFDMLQKQDPRYASTTTASKISTMADLVSMKFRSSGRSLASHIDKMAGLLEKLKSMKSDVDDVLATGILLAFVDVPELNPVIAALKTLAEEDITWDTVTTRLLDEWSDVNERALTARVGAGRVVHA